MSAARRGLRRSTVGASAGSEALRGGGVVAVSGGQVEVRGGQQEAVEVGG